MKKKQAKMPRQSGKKIKDARELIFKTPGSIATKYTVVFKTDEQCHLFHFSGMHSPAEALWKALSEYLASSCSQRPVTKVFVTGYSQTKKERAQGVAYADLHFPLFPASE